MELLFESRREVVGRRGRLLAFQNTASVSPDPILSPDEDHDRGGCAIYGTVLAEKGSFRMWYQAAAGDHRWDQDFSDVAMAESEDGLVWRKPAGPSGQKLTNLGLHSPAISKQGDLYLATGCGKRSSGRNAAAREPGYYLATSRDGWEWELAPGVPPIPGGDVITSLWDERIQTGHAVFKHLRYHGGIQRRCLFEADFTADGWATPRLALMSTDADDHVALMRGGRSADYYGMTLLSSGKTASLGLVWVFYHQPPYYQSGSGIFGGSALVPVFRERPEDPWIFAPGRQPFLEHPAGHALAPFFYAASSILTVGDEQRLYCTAFHRGHGWTLNEQRKRETAVVEQLQAEGIASLHVARWARDRFFGFRAETEAELILDLGPITAPASLRLNYRTTPGGWIRVSVAKNGPGTFLPGFSPLPDQAEPGWSADECLPLEGDAVDGDVHWTTGTTLPVTTPDQSLIVTIKLFLAECYAYEIVSP